MTYCLGIKTHEGIAGLADTRISSGTDTTTAKKIYTVNRDRHSFFIMTSGLRSVRDKAIAYFTEIIEEEDGSIDKLYKIVNKFGTQVRRVATEDKKTLEEAGMAFNLYSIVGGQLQNDSDPKLYLLYPEGNWIEVTPGTPYIIIGNSGFGTPVLRRALTYNEPLDYAIRCAFLSFDATRLSANDVDYPVDTVILKNNTYHSVENRFERSELEHLSEFWNERLRTAVNDLPADILNKAFREEHTEDKRRYTSDTQAATQTPDNIKPIHIE